jgi:hypothetical protein
VSGGQTGADRAALDWALKRGSSGSYLQRTEWNVRDSDGTVVFSLAPQLAGGSLKTVEFARKHNRPLIHVSAVDPDPAGRLQRFLEDNVIDTLNIAGPRKSKEPGIAEFVYRILDQAFFAP